MLSSFVYDGGEEYNNNLCREVLFYEGLTHS